MPNTTETNVVEFVKTALLEAIGTGKYGKALSLSSDQFATRYVDFVKSSIFQNLSADEMEEVLMNPFGSSDPKANKASIGLALIELGIMGKLSRESAYIFETILGQIYFFEDRVHSFLSRSRDKLTCTTSESTDAIAFQFDLKSGAIFYLDTARADWIDLSKALGSNMEDRQKRRLSYATLDTLNDALAQQETFATRRIDQALDRLGLTVWNYS